MTTGTNMNSKQVSDRGNWSTFFRGYKCDEKMTTAQRIAHLLNWAADHGPGVLIPYNIILKYIMGFEHTPRMGNEEVETLRRKLSSVRPHLQKTYSRDLKNVTGVGARATTDSLDLVKQSMPANVRRVNSSHAALKRNAELVDVAKLPASGPDKSWRDWYIKTVPPALKALQSDERIAKLLPPKPQGEGQEQ